MKSHKIRLKQDNMLCHRCLMNAVKALSQLSGIEELDVSLEKKRINVTYNDKHITREMIQKAVDEAIVHGKIKKINEV
ncbi:MAG: heavy-metal-associated domain-containing protein [Bacillota bacterium]